MTTPIMSHESTGKERKPMATLDRMTLSKRNTFGFGLSTKWPNRSKRSQKSTYLCCMAVALYRADYLFVVGHYPMFASDWHNVSWCLVPKLQNLMEKYHATAYLCGHAHNVQVCARNLFVFSSVSTCLPGTSFQHVSTISRVSGHPIHHVLSGAGHLSKTNYLPVFDTLSENPWNLTSQFFFPMPRSGVPKKMLDRGALVYVDLGPESGTVEYYKCNGERMYSFEMKPRKRPT